MSDTYCGKNCDACSLKADNKCTGCKAGPGAIENDGCKIAECSKKNGHESCEKCEYMTFCVDFSDRGHMELGKEKRMIDPVSSSSTPGHTGSTAVEGEKITDTTNLRRWVMALFVLTVISMIASLGLIVISLKTTQYMRLKSATLEDLEKMLVFAEKAESFQKAFTMIRDVCAALYGFVLLVLMKEDSEYLKAGVLKLINFVCMFVLVPNIKDVWAALLISVVLAIIIIASEYFEMTAHSNVLVGLNDILSDRWLGLRKWVILLNLLLIASLLIVMLSPVIGAIFTIAVGIATIIYDIIKFVTLGQTAKSF